MNTGPADLLCNTDMVATNLDNYVDSGIKYTIDNHESISFPISTTCKKPVLFNVLDTMIFQEQSWF